MFVQIPEWWQAGRMVLVSIAVVTVALEVWMVIEAALMFPRVRNVLEEGPLEQRVAPVGLG